jgi:hypothetical protein
MLNVVDFRERAPRSRRSKYERPPANVGTDISELASRFTRLESKAKGEIQNAVLMLDRAAQHARQIAKRISDPTVKRTFDEHVSIIEQLLQIARGMALKL